MLKSLHLNVKIRLAESFLDCLLACMILPFMIVYFTQHFGEVTAGLLSGINILLGIASTIYGGYLADHIGRRKIIIVSSSISIINYSIMAMANWYVEMPVITFVCCSVNSILSGLSAPATRSMTIDATTAEQRKFVYGIQYWLFNISFLIGSLLGGTLFAHYKAELMIGMIMVSIISFILIKFFISELYVPNVITKSLLKRYFIVLKDWKFILYVVGIGLIMSTEHQVRSYNLIKFAERDELFHYSILVSENTILVVLLGLFSTYLIRKLDHQKIVTSVGIIFVISTALMAGFSELWILVMLMAIVTIAELAIVPAEQSLMADIIPEDNRSVYIACDQLLGRLLMLLVPLAIIIGHFLTHFQMVGYFSFLGLTGVMLVFLIGKKT
jgi:DHA1 family multidrug resistance protein B-like MFS transporter